VLQWFDRIDKRKECALLFSTRMLTDCNDSSEQKRGLLTYCQTLVVQAQGQHVHTIIQAQGQTCKCSYISIQYKHVYASEY